MKICGNNQDQIKTLMNFQSQKESEGGGALKKITATIIVDDETAEDVIESLDEVLDQFISTMNDNEIALWVETSDPVDISLEDADKFIKG